MPSREGSSDGYRELWLGKLPPVSLSMGEILIVVVVALLVLGPSRLPEAARQVGKALSEFRRVSTGVQAELREALAEPASSPPPAPQPLSETAMPALAIEPDPTDSVEEAHKGTPASQRGESQSS